MLREQLLEKGVGTGKGGDFVVVRTGNGDCYRMMHQQGGERSLRQWRHNWDCTREAMEKIRTGEDSDATVVPDSLIRQNSSGNAAPGPAYSWNCRKNDWNNALQRSDHAVRQERDGDAAAILYKNPQA